MNMTYKTKFFLNSKYLLCLTVFYAVFCLSADVVAFRFTGFGPVVESGATLLFPLTYLISDIVAEVYGYNVAKMLIWLILIGEVIFALLLRLVMLTPTAPFFHDDQAFGLVINPMLRFVISGVVANVASDFMNIYIISKWKILAKGRLFWLRSIVSTAISELVLILIVVILAFSSTLDVKSLMQVLVSAYGLELVYAFIFVWPGWALSSFLKRAENLDVFDYNINYNPFKFAGLHKEINND